MSEWFDVILFSLLGGVLGLSGGLYLLYGGKRGTDLLKRLSVPLAAGSLLAASFLDLLPHAVEEGEPHEVMMFALGGFLAFFITERLLRWFHHHHEHEGSADQANKSLIVFGDSLHNFIDGMAIGAAFLVSPATGVVVTMAVAAHELPQEIGDFGLLLSKGMKRSRVLLVNVGSAFLTLIGAVLVFGLGGELGIDTSLLLAVTAGFFIYIAAADIIPTIHQKNENKTANGDTIILIASTALVGYLILALHHLLES